MIIFVDGCNEREGKEIDFESSGSQKVYGTLAINKSSWVWEGNKCDPLCHFNSRDDLGHIWSIPYLIFLTFILNMEIIWEYYVEYYQSHITLLWVWIMLCL